MEDQHNLKKIKNFIITFLLKEVNYSVALHNSTSDSITFRLSL